MNRIPYLSLDVFTDTQFEGNPLAVVIDPPALSDDTMQRIAAEFNLSETIFLTGVGSERWDARIFTPGGELPFAGHPTVGGAVALAAGGHAVPQDDGIARIVLAEVAGDVAVSITFDGATPVSAQFAAPKPPEQLGAVILDDDLLALLRCVGLGEDDASPSMPAGTWSAGVPFTIVPLANIDALSRAVVDGGLLATYAAPAAPPFLYLMARDEPANSWRTRMFAAGLGIVEDPATGGAACAAAGLLASVAEDGQHTWRLTQGVEMGRRSHMSLSAHVSSGMATAVTLAGGAVLVGEGTLTLTAG